MEDGTKEDPAQQKEPKFLGKAGWLKKAPGRLLASYKDRYIHVEKTDLVVYEQEDLKNCLERLDLENYDKCLEIKSPFKKKHRLVLIRSPKAANKVHDAKFQAQSAEEKEAWIKALSDGINRAKNKVFDEVKVDDSSNLEHVTRTRPKGNRNRRPPTRIHMKEVADVSSDGILRLDLDLEDAVMPNGTYQTDGGERTATLRVPEEDARSEPEEVPPKKVLKPPMPPTKEAKVSPAPQEEADKDDTPEKKVLKPPMPPSKEAKPCASPVEEASDEPQPEQVSEKSPEAKKKAVPPPTPPNKPSAHSPATNPAEAFQPRPNSHPPTPPSKEKKPAQSAAEPDQERQDSEQEDAREVDAGEESPDVKGGTSEEESSESESSEAKAESDKEPQIATDCLRKSPIPLPRATKRPEIPKTDSPAAAALPPPQPDLPAPDTSPSSLPAEEPESEVPSIIVSLNDPLTDSLGLSPLLHHSSGGRRRKEEEKSVDSGQHSDDESEGSACEDTLAASTAALRGSHVGLDMLDTSEDDLQAAVILRPAPAANKPQAGHGVPPNRLSEPTTPLKPEARAKSASSGDLLSSSAAGARSTQARRGGTGTKAASPDDLTMLKSEVALEMEETNDLLSTVAKMGADGEDTPEELLAQAMEKLQKADHVLREVNKLQIKHNSPDRKSW